MIKQYKYKDKTFDLKPLTLGLLRDVMPVLVKLRKLIHKYTCDIDMTDVNKARQVIAELEKAKEQLGEQLEGQQPNDERIHTINRIDQLNNKIALHKNELENNNELSEKIRLYNECSALAVYELFTDAEMIKPVLAKLLDPAAEIDTGDPGCIKFISEVMTNFFLSIKMNKSA